MKRYYSLFAVTLLSVLSGCGGSPYESGKAYAKTVISRLNSGDMNDLQKFQTEAEEKAKGMSPSDLVNFMKGYNEVTQEHLRAKMPK